MILGFAPVIVAGVALTVRAVLRRSWADAGAAVLTPTGMVLGWLCFQRHLVWAGAGAAVCGLALLVLIQKRSGSAGNSL
ncbi:hypothetical protein [Kitasatospora sp. MMS16-BH015]|uniref:hypothetical protein n=1 Tax=Kitasatospora sp. MMS16-BH015 TaxID=2018025 RepID=UPI00131A4F89|nr:hypothetical protein [Kitasatospora sp. MMS16-BH015]